MYLAVDSKGREFKFNKHPFRIWADRNDRSKGGSWRAHGNDYNWHSLESGTIERWTGVELSWEDTPMMTSQNKINERKIEEAPQGLIQVLREQTDDLKVLFLEKTEAYARNQFAWAQEFLQTAKDWNFEKRKGNLKDISRATMIWRTGEEKLIERELKLANLHYENSLLKLVDRLTKKGLTDTNFKILAKSLEINFELVLEHEVKSNRIITRCWTIIAGGEIQRPHYRYLVK